MKKSAILSRIYGIIRKTTGKRCNYDEIFLGYPNYWGTMPMAVYTFLEAFDFSGKKIHPFCTHEGSGLSSTERDIKKAAKGATVMKGIAIHGSEADQALKKIQSWV